MNHDSSFCYAKAINPIKVDNFILLTTKQTLVQLKSFKIAKENNWHIKGENNEPKRNLSSGESIQAMYDISCTSIITLLRALRIIREQ